ncbi:acetolactate synthase, large subunit, biosynthetic type [Burkholderia sp. ABCPW 111]|nr:acetolactate synthase, large subunit, biosynthetic type [Burkholderia sp. ABCPW 111]
MKPAFQLDAPLEPEPQARQRAPDQFFAENSKGPR